MQSLDGNLGCHLWKLADTFYLWGEWCIGEITENDYGEWIAVYHKLELLKH
jgi:hypothetical protein